MATDASLKRLIAEFLFIVIRLAPMLLGVAGVVFLVELVSARSASEAMGSAVDFLVIGTLVTPFTWTLMMRESRALIMLAVAWFALFLPLGVLVLESAGF
jgi:hypothetical protein